MAQSKKKQVANQETSAAKLPRKKNAKGKTRRPGSSDQGEPSKPGESKRSDRDGRDSRDGRDDKGGLGEGSTGTVKTMTEVARHFKVTTQTVTGWVSRVDPMPGEKGKYDLQEIAEWRANTFSKGKDQQIIDADAAGAPKQRERTTMQQLKLELEETKLRKETALATQNEIKANKMNEQFVQLNHINEWITEFLILQRKLLTSIPVEMFAAAPDDIKTIYQPDLKARIDIHLNQMADWIERVDDLRDYRR